MKNTYTAVCSGVCIFFVALNAIIFFTLHSGTEEFIVRPYEHDSYHTITDEIRGDAAIIYDITNDAVIAGKNTTQPTSIASITKLTAALIAHPLLNEDDITTLESSDFAALPNTPLRLGERWRTVDLLEYSLITSSNRGISAVGRTVENKTGTPLVDLMNDFVRRNALVQTHFINPTGLDAHNTLAGSESSAFDLAKIASIIVVTQRELARHTVRREKTFYSLDGTRYDAENTNTLIGGLPDRILLSKTGYTDIAGGALIMVVARDGGRFAYVVLGSTRAGRFEDMETLLRLHGDGAFTDGARTPAPHG